MIYKVDNLKNALLLKTGINVLKYLEIILIVPLLIKNLNTEYAEYLFIVASLNIIFFFDFNLQNYGVNLLYRKNSTRTKLIFYSEYLRLFFPLIVLVVVVLLVLNFSQLNYAWLLISFLFLLNFYSAQWGSFITSSKGFYYSSLISLGYNSLNIFLILLLDPKTLLSLAFIKFSTSLLLFVVTILYIKLNFNNFALFPLINLNLKSYKKIIDIAFITKEYSFQKGIEFINGNFLALLIIPFDKILGTQLIVIKSVLSITVFITNFFVKIYQQLFLNKVNSNLISNLFKVNNALFLFTAVFISIFYMNDFLLIIKNYFNFDDTILHINSELVFLLIAQVLFINLNKQLNIKRNTRLLSMTFLIIPTVIYISIFIFFVSFKSMFDPELILLTLVVCEIFYYLSLKKGLDESV